MKNKGGSRQRLKPREVEALLKELKQSFYRDFIVDMPIDTLLPSVNELSETYNISFAMARKFYDQLSEEGIIRSEPRKGYYISETAERKIAETNKTTCLIGVVGYLECQNPLAYTCHTAQVLEVFEKKTNEQGWRVQFFNTYPQRFIDYDMTLAMAKASLNVIMYLGGAKPEEDINEIRKLEVPIIASEQISEFVTNISYDHRLIGYNAGQYLVESGFKRIAFVTHYASDWSDERKKGYLEALDQKGLAEHVYRLDPSEPDYQKCIVDIMADNIDAIFCVNDEIALNLRNSGLNCKNIAIMGVDDLVDSRHHNLTTIQRSNGAIAEAAFKTLVNYFIHRIPFPPKVTLKGNLLKRESTESIKINEEIAYV